MKKPTNIKEKNFDRKGIDEKKKYFQLPKLISLHDHHPYFRRIHREEMNEFKGKNY